MVANAYVKPTLKPGDEIIVSLLEHHANIVPWQLIAQETGAVIKVIPVDKDGQLLLHELKGVKGLTIVGTAANKSSALSFKLDGYSDDEVGARLDSYGIAVRVGHHCAQPVLRHFGYESVVRPTIAFYNSPDDIDKLVRVLKTFA